MSSAEAMKTETLTSTDLRADTVGVFHPVTVKQISVIKDSVLKTTVSPASSLEEAESVCLLIEHPNGDEEILYEYTSSIIRYGNTEYCGIETGDTIWIADWDDVYRPVLTPPERDYVICQSKAEARQINTLNHPEGRAFVTYAGAVIIGLFSGGLFGFLLGTLVSGAGILTFILALTGAVLAMVIASPDDYTEIYSQPSALSKDADYIVLPDLNTEVIDDIDTYASLFNSWREVVITATNVEKGEISVQDQQTGTETVLHFNSPRKWDTKYEMVKLTDKFGVGAVENLIGESIEIRFADHHTVDEANVLETSDKMFYVQL